MAQNNFDKPIIIIRNTTFICESSPKYKSVRVRNANNILSKQENNIPYSEHTGAVKMDFYPKLCEIVKSTFSKQRIEELSKDKTSAIAISYFIYRGKAKELRFSFQANTKLTPSELADLEANIKKDLIFHYTSPKYEKANFIFFSSPLRFNKL
jgi:hypothetical protein